LPGLVLGPRTGLHVAVLAAARQLRAEVAVMTTTANAAINIAAHGQPFRTYQDLLLRYALHGHVPYEHINLLAQLYETHRADTAARVAFETWFLPLYALKAKNGVHAGQLPALFAHFSRARPAHPDPVIVHDIRRSVRAGDIDWVMRRLALAHAMTLARDMPS
jgi:hypothetical protein